MVRLNSVIKTRGAVVILIAAMLSLTFQPVLASSSMTSAQCADAQHDAAMGQVPDMAEHEHNADLSSCCSDNESSDQHECGNLCATSCSTSITADVPFETTPLTIPAHPQYEVNFMRAPLQDNAAFIPPPPRI